MTLVTFGIAAILLTAFVLTEATTSQPVTPLRLFTDRTRAASYVARVLVVGAMFGTFFFLSQFIQDVLGFSPVKAGLAFLPMTFMLFAVSRLAPRLMTRFGPKQLMLVGLAPAVGGLAWLGQITPATTYWPGVLGPMLMMGFGMGLAFVPLTSASLAGVAPEDSGAASAMVNVAQQVGGALGLAALVTVYGNASHAAARHVGATAVRWPSRCSRTEWRPRSRPPRSSTRSRSSWSSSPCGCAPRWSPSGKPARTDPAAAAEPGCGRLRPPADPNWLAAGRPGRLGC